MHRPTLTAFLVAPLVGFNLASAVGLCASSWERADEPSAGIVGGAASAAVQPSPADDAYRAGRTWGGELVAGALPVDDAACDDAATRWWTYERTSSRAAGDDVDAERDGYRQGCVDALGAAASAAG